MNEKYIQKKLEGIDLRAWFYAVILLISMVLLHSNSIKEIKQSIVEQNHKIDSLITIINTDK